MRRGWRRQNGTPWLRMETPTRRRESWRDGGCSLRRRALTSLAPMGLPRVAPASQGDHRSISRGIKTIAVCAPLRTDRVDYCNCSQPLTEWPRIFATQQLRQLEKTFCWTPMLPGPPGPMIAGPRIAGAMIAGPMIAGPHELSLTSRIESDCSAPSSNHVSQRRTARTKERHRANIGKPLIQVL